jgi:pantoate--beta-alanine ligase
MQVASSVVEIKQIVKKVKQQGKTVGFVPTMGYLHKGHLSLLKAASKENDFVVLSIFVNPVQFGPNEDLDKYPRDFERDSALAKECGTDVIFFPTPEIMYPEGYNSYVVSEALDKNLCGAKRPGHFKGVMTVVLKLFNIVSPDNTYFGQKDIQQARIIEQMIEDFNLDVKINIMPIIREEDGLAMSSRNVYLSKNEREQAIVLFESLQKAKDLFEKGEKTSATIIDKVIKTINNASLAQIDYVELVDYKTLTPLNGVIKHKAVLAVAVYFGKTRLIDNIILE